MNDVLKKKFKVYLGVEPILKEGNPKNNRHENKNENRKKKTYIPNGEENANFYLKIVFSYLLRIFLCTPIDTTFRILLCITIVHRNDFFKILSLIFCCFPKYSP